MDHADCARIAELAPASVLGALDAEERGLLRAHVLACGRRHPEFREALALAAALGSTWPERDAPSPALRDRLLRSLHPPH